ncbi:hypothetical protein [Desulfosporosinus sp. I2]|uniref:hypothetical protein n=1 Tax=Desulfosporosinus sp. I2 TaxID=1617025 RepID=UPI001A9A5361|nr:hypothetical protein [Desulfosporosinus sp. I2]
MNGSMLKVIPAIVKEVRAFVTNAPFYAPSPGRSVTRARRLYVSRPANFRVSDPDTG